MRPTGRTADCLKSYVSTKEGLEIRDFDIRHTLESAQPLTFHADYDFEGGTISYASGKKMVHARISKGKEGNASVRFGSDADWARKEFIRRFRIRQDNMHGIYEGMSDDAFVSSAIEKYRGMRLTLNDPWETTVCFIISQFNNVKRIRRIVRTLVSRYGSDIIVDGKIVGRSFPTSGELVRAKDRGFRECGAGFRARYLASAADYCTNNLDLYSLEGKSYGSIKESLMEIDGVGEKVADCIALMGYGKLEAFPIDVWVKRTLERQYFNGRKRSIRQLHEFVSRKWPGETAGYAQQYIFHHGRNL